MALSSMRNSPRILAVPVTSASTPPVRLRVEPFMPGNVVQALSPGAAVLTGAALNRFTTGKYASIKIAKADVTPAADTVGQTAAARDASGNVTGDLILTFGSASGDIMDALGACADVTVPADNLTVIVFVNGVPYSRINDAAVPNPGVLQWGKDSDNNYMITIGAATGVDLLRVGTEIEVFIGLNIGVLAKYSATAAYAAGTALVAGVPEERFLGVSTAGVDTAGRTTAQLINYDVVLGSVAAATLISITK